MLFRFCLYGFLKNQRYFEPFLVLIFLDRGLSFLSIGALVAIREIATNLLEVVSGALADTWGRRRAMVTSFVAYLASFLIFGLSHDFGLLAVAMILYGVGDAFRSGTHKAMILTWLRNQGRADDKTRIYGLTRSWSKIGSAVGVALGAVWVLATGTMDGLFWLAAIPYALGLTNLLGYPPALEGAHAQASLSPRAAWRHLTTSLRDILRSPPLRGLMWESAGFMGTFKATKDYLQPVLQAAAAGGLLAVLGLGTLDDIRATALLTGPVFVVLYLWSAAMSRRAHTLVERAGSADRAAHWLWRLFAAAFALLLGAALWNIHAGLILGFVALYALEALWRPIVISRFDDRGPEHQGATLLSVESQIRSLATMLLAPPLGYAIDLATAAPHSPSPWWPIAVLGLGAGLIFVLKTRLRTE